MKDAITVQTVVNAPMEKVWECWNKPEHITGWAFASDDWEAPTAENVTENLNLLRCMYKMVSIYFAVLVNFR